MVCRGGILAQRMPSVPSGIRVLFRGGGESTRPAGGAHRGGQEALRALVCEGRPSSPCHSNLRPPGWLELSLGNQSQQFQSTLCYQCPEDAPS